MTNPVKFINQFPDSPAFRRYLPSAFDNSLDIYETLVAMREYLNQVIANENQLTKEMFELKEWITANLEIYSRQQINKLVADGTFDYIFKEKIFKDLYEEVFSMKIEMDAEYRKKTQDIHMHDLGDDVKSAITGQTAVAPSPGPLTIESIHVKNDGLTHRELDIIKKTKNLIETELRGYGLDISNGNIIQNEFLVATNFIKIAPEVNFYKSSQGSICFYDKDKKFLSAMNMETNKGIYKTPANCYYVRCSFYLQFIGDFIVALAIQEIPYEKFEKWLDETIQVRNKSLRNNDIEGSKLADGTTSLDKLQNMIKSKNLYNSNIASEGYLDRSNGLLVPDPFNRASALIKLDNRKNLVLSPKVTNNSNVCFYDATGKYISGIQITPTSDNQKILVPDAASQVRFSVNVNDYKSMQLEYGDVPTDFEAFYNYPRDLVYPPVNNGGGSTDNSILVNKGTESISLKMNGRAVTYNMKHYVVPFTDGKPMQNMDIWRLDGCTQKNGSAVTNQGAWETAIEIDGLPDFIGSFHGYEKMASIKFLVDGVNRQGNFIANARKVEIHYVANLIKQGTENEVVGVIRRHYTFTDKVKIEQYIKWSTSLKIKNAYMSMLPILRTGVTTTAFRNFDLEEYDVSTTAPVNIHSPKANIKEATIYGNRVNANVKVKFEKELNNRFFLSDSSLYNKLYFSYAYDTTTQPNDEWYYVSEYDIISS